MGAFTRVISALLNRILFLLVRFAVLCVRWLVEEANGVNKLRRQSELRENYHRSAEILTVRGRNIFCFSDMARLSNFIMIHDRFTTPDYVMKKDSISLYFFNDKIAVFVDSGEETPLWDMKFGDFYRMSAFQKSKKIIVMPLSSFLRISKNLDDPRGEVVFIGNVTRCGSTLLMHIFAKTGQCAVFSEPESLNSLAKMTRQNRFGTESEKRELYQAAIKMECKPLTSRSPTVYVFKMTGSNIFIDISIREYFPQGKHLYLYRNIPDVVMSFRKVVSALPGLAMAAFLLGYSNILDGLLDDRFACFHNPLGVNFYGVLEYSTLMPMASMKHHLSHSSEKSTPAFRYEDLIKNPQEVVAEIYKFVGLNPECTEEGMSALKFNSQENSVLAPDKLTKTRESRHVIEVISEKMLARAGLPPSRECAILAGTKCVQDKQRI